MLEWDRWGEDKVKHPFSGEYIKMAAAAADMQAARLTDKVFQSGDYVIFESSFTPSGMVSMIDEHSHNIPQDNAQAWIPNLHQLMDMFGGYKASLEAIRSGLGSPAAGSLPGYYERFKSWEECVLAVLMLLKADKIWNGDAWAPRGL